MFCRKLKGQNYCIDKEPNMSAITIIKKQLNAMKKNDVNNSGIKVAYEFASPANKQFTGPYPNFVNMVKNKNYQHLLNHDKYTVVSQESYNNDMNYKAVVDVYKKNKKYRYIFELSRQYNFEKNSPLVDNRTEIGLGYLDLYLYWRTDSVMLELVSNIPKKPNKSKKLEKFTSKKVENFTSKTAKNINNKPLQVCSTNPMTGYFRDGYCHTDETDSGTHVVCAKVDDKFLKFTKGRGNDLSTPSNSFPGLKPGDNWCLCALRWKEAYEAGKAPRVNLNATNIKAKEFDIEKRLREFKL